MDPRPVYLLLHVLCVVIWVGGMFFAYVCLRPVAANVLDAAARLRLWVGVFSRFFPLVWVCVGLLLGSGLAMIQQLGFAIAPLHWHLMFGLGLLMMAVFGHVFFAPWQRLKLAVDLEDWSAGARALAQIRRLVGVNLTLGMVTIAMATIGRWLSV